MGSVCPTLLSGSNRQLFRIQSAGLTVRPGCFASRAWWAMLPNGCVLRSKSGDPDVVDDAVAPLVDVSGIADQHPNLPAKNLDIQDRHLAVAEVLMHLGDAVSRSGQGPGQFGPLPGVERGELIPEGQPLLD